MRLAEIEQTTAAEKRVAQMQGNAKAEKDRAKQSKAQADMSAERLEVKKSREKLGQLQQAAVTTSIKPHV
mgnify:CR=1 FL=1